MPVERRGTAPELCPCGRTLHYTDPEVERIMQELVARAGLFVTLTTPAGSWRVPRHYIALHGLVGSDVHQLADHFGWARAL